MYLEKLELQGFKSFAHKTLLDFKTKNKKPHMAAIVGPNGCGKSNFADAVRWVLGEQSLKNLRGKKSEDVIFSGSDKKSRLGLAEVSLYLNNEDLKSSLDYSEIAITRRLYRNGDSEYLINRKKVRLQDILLLLAKANFGQKTYSVIGQGMADSILIATPKERKEFFDEAAGIKQYQLKRDQAINKLDASQENLNQAEGLINEIEPRLKSLTRQVNRLERREQIEKELKEWQLSYYGSLWHDFTEKIKIEESQSKKIESRRREASLKLHEIQNKLEGLKKEKSRSYAFEELQKIYENILEEKNKLRERELILKNKIELEKNIKTEKKTTLPITQIIEELEYYQKTQSKLIDKVYKIDSLDKLAATKQEFFLLNEKLGKLITKIKNPEGKEKKSAINPEFFKELEKIAGEILEINKKVESIQYKISHFNEEEEAKKDHLFDLQKDFQEKQSVLSELDIELNKIRVELARHETRKEDLEREIKEDIEDKSQLKNVRLDETKRYEIKEKIQKLKHQLELIGGIDPEVVEEFKETKERYEFLSTQSEDLKKAIKSTIKALEDLDQTIKKIFDESFKKINHEFEKYFKVLFGGGKAHLILHKEKESEEETLDLEQNPEEPEKPREFLPQINKQKKVKMEKVISGIEINATPPGKRVKNINMLSGGERAMTSIALICAIISTNPSPFVVLDEVDAALDESNSERFAQILADLSHHTQFVVITHNRATMKKAEVLYGVTMGDDGVSKLLSVNLADTD